MIQALKGVCHGTIKANGSSVVADGAALFGEAERPRAEWRAQPTVCGSGSARR